MERAYKETILGTIATVTIATLVYATENHDVLAILAGLFTMAVLVTLKGLYGLATK